jgi:adenylate cyclase
MAEQTPIGNTRQARRLCAVLLADMTGFSRLMGENEERALAAIARIRDVFSSVVPGRRGTLEVQVGDCFVALFDSAVDAVEAAVAIQTELSAAPAATADRVRIRIGLHLGEVLREGSEVFGDSINIAARLQTVARPGGVALSEDVYRAVRSRVDIAFRDLGAHQLKNIRGRLHVYEVVLDGETRNAPVRGHVARRRLLVGAGLAAVAIVGLAAYELLTRVPPETKAPGPARAGSAAQSAGARASAERPLVVGVMAIAARGDVPDWEREVTRDGLNTILSKVTGLRVYSRQKIDFVREKQGLSELEAAEKLGIAKMISGALGNDGGKLTLELQVVDIASGLLDASERVSGEQSQLIELQNELAANVLRTLHIELSPQERASLFAQRTNDTLDAYRMLADTLGGVTKKDASPSRAPDASRSKSGSSWLSWSATAWAAPADADEEAIRAVILEWAAALQAKDLSRVAAVMVEVADTQRAALTRYFENADRLSVSVADIDVLVAGDEALATFTRKDSFVDKRSGRDLQLEVRLSSELARTSTGWKLRGVKNS